MPERFTDNEYFEGFAEFANFVAALRAKSVQAANGFMLRAMRDHRDEVAKASTFKRLRPASLRRMIRIEPKKASTNARALRNVVGESFTFWGSGEPGDPRDAAAARAEKEIGPRETKARTGRLLLLPAGDFLTETGFPRRKKQGGRVQAIDLSKLPDTVIVQSKGRILLVQTLDAGERGQFEKTPGIGLTASGRKRTVSKKKLARRSRVIGTLVPSVEQTRPLDFFGSWDRREGERDRIGDQALDALASGKPLR